MKKIISIITAAAIMLSSLVCFADYSDLTSDDACYNAVGRLSDFGIMSGYEDGTFKPDKDVTRAETARLLCSAMNQEGIEEDLYFSDLPADYWAKKYIALMASLGYITGYDDNTFRPEKHVTYNEFIKMLISVLGYSVFAENIGGYPMGYIEYAKNNKITEGISFSGEENVKRREAAIMLNRALDVPIVIVDGYSAGLNGAMNPIYQTMNQTGNNYQTLLTYFHNIYTATGTIGKDDSLPVEDKKQESKPEGTDESGETSQTGTGTTKTYSASSAFVMLDGLDIMPFDENVNLSKSVTRGDFAKYASRLAGRGTIEKKQSDSRTTKLYDDVAENSSIYDAVDIMTQSGYMDGFTENGKKLFKPNEIMTEEECIEILMKMLKYDTLKSDYMSDAKELGLTKYRDLYKTDLFHIDVLAMYLAGAAELAGIK